jgi:hypothetical protein
MRRVLKSERRNEMRNKKVLLVVLLALVLSALHLNAEVLATSTPTQVSFQYIKVKTLSPGKVWVDKFGMHIRGRVDSGVVSGGLMGSAVVVYNADLNPFVRDTFAPSPGNGAASGTIKIYTKPAGTGSSAPTWEGSWKYSVVNGKVAGGEMEAVDLAKQLVMRIVSVTELVDGKLNHSGTIEPLVCIQPNACPFPTAP